MQEHDFHPEYDRCIHCDCRPWGQWASLPCGTTEIPEGHPYQTWGEFQFKSALYFATKEAMSQ